MEIYEYFIEFLLIMIYNLQLYNRQIQLKFQKHGEICVPQFLLAVVGLWSVKVSVLRWSKETKRQLPRVA